MRSISPADPVRVFQELLKHKQWRNKWLAGEFDIADFRQQMFAHPFIEGFVKAYKQMRGFKAQRSMLSLFAPYFPVEVTMEAFNVSRWKVYVAKLHKAQEGAGQPIRTVHRREKRISFDRATSLAAFSMSPDNVQTVAHTKKLNTITRERRENRFKLWKKFVKLARELKQKPVSRCVLV